ncbi:hypothetical protein IT157_03765 [bacterium]|nr:hypothetical protein [bacterium]
MKKIAVLIASLALFWLGCESEPGQAPLSSTQSSDVVTQSAEAEFDALLGQISKMDEQGIDVPQEVYDRYFELEAQLHPEYYEQSARGHAVVLDELEDVCPGTLVEGPEEGTMTYSVCGQTYNANNDCTYPDCRYGRDVVVRLEVENFQPILITTTGSRFDTYLCLYMDECCGEEGAVVLERNNNAPNLCNGQFLAAGIQRCVFQGTYYIVLDGASPAARGSYCLNITLLDEFCD